MTIRKTMIAAFISAAIAPPVSSYALGLGQSTVYSHINEPLKLRVPVLGGDSASLKGEMVGIADEAVLARMGLESVPGLQTRLVKEGKGAFIEVYTLESFTEPVVDTVVVVALPSGGSIFRGITGLIDPSLLPGDHQVNVSLDAASPKTKNEGSQESPKTTTKSKSVRLQQRESIKAKFDGRYYGPVTPEDTLYRIAVTFAPNGCSWDEVAKAIVKANPKAFLNDDMNRLEKGATLWVPVTKKEVFDTLAFDNDAVAPIKEYEPKEPSSQSAKFESGAAGEFDAIASSRLTIIPSEEESNLLELLALEKQNAKLQEDNKFYREKLDKLTKSVSSLDGEIDKFNDAIAKYEKLLDKINSEPKKTPLKVAITEVPVASIKKTPAQVENIEVPVAGISSTESVEEEKSWTAYLLYLLIAFMSALFLMTGGVILYWRSIRLNKPGKKASKKLPLALPHDAIRFQAEPKEVAESECDAVLVKDESKSSEKSNLESVNDATTTTDEFQFTSENGNAGDAGIDLACEVVQAFSGDNKDVTDAEVTPNDFEFDFSETLESEEGTESALETKSNVEPENELGFDFNGETDDGSEFPLEGESGEPSGEEGGFVSEAGTFDFDDVEVDGEKELTIEDVDESDFDVEAFNVSEEDDGLDVDLDLFVNKEGSQSEDIHLNKEQDEDIFDTDIEDDLKVGDFAGDDELLFDEADVDSKIDLATMYLSMGDEQAALNLLQEAANEGDDTQREKAEKMIEEMRLAG